MARIICDTHDAVATVVQVEDQLIILLLSFLSLLLGLFQLFLVLLTHGKAVVSIHIEEHHIVVALSAPATMTAENCL